MCLTYLLIFFWRYALETAVYILNRILSKSMPSTPYEIWRGKKPNLKYLKIWGYPAYVKRNFGHKIDARVDKCLFVRYPRDSIGHLFYYLTE